MSDNENVARPSDNEEEDEEEYVVEGVRNKKIIDGEVHYLLKWKGYSEAENTWEPLEHCGCQALIDEYEAQRAAKQKQSKPKKSKRSLEGPDEAGRSGSSASKKSKSANQNKDSCAARREELQESSSAKKQGKKPGFERGLEAEEILGATNEVGTEYSFLIKWKGTDDAELVPARIANARYPQQVIKFYESHLTWANTDRKIEISHGP